MATGEGHSDALGEGASMSKIEKAIGRRRFLKGATAAGAALGAPAAAAEPVPASTTAPGAPPLPDIARETMPPPADPVQQTSSGADFMLDVLKTFDFDYVTETPASTFRGLHEAIINYGENKK